LNEPCDGGAATSAQSPCDAAAMAELRGIIDRQAELERELLGLRDRATALAMAMKHLLEARLKQRRVADSSRLQFFTELCMPHQVAHATANATNRCLAFCHHRQSRLFPSGVTV
jgi:hypothetical protein